MFVLNKICRCVHISCLHGHWTLVDASRSHSKGEHTVVIEVSTILHTGTPIPFIYIQSMIKCIVCNGTSAASALESLQHRVWQSVWLGFQMWARAVWSTLWNDPRSTAQTCYSLDRPRTCQWSSWSTASRPFIFLALYSMKIRMMMWPASVRVVEEKEKDNPLAI